MGPPLSILRRFPFLYRPHLTPAQAHVKRELEAVLQYQKPRLYLAMVIRTPTQSSSDLSGWVVMVPAAVMPLLGVMATT